MNPFKSVKGIMILALIVGFEMGLLIGSSRKSPIGANSLLLGMLNINWMVFVGFIPLPRAVKKDPSSCPRIRIYNMTSFLILILELAFPICLFVSYGPLRGPSIGLLIAYLTATLLFNVCVRMVFDKLSVAGLKTQPSEPASSYRLEPALTSQSELDVLPD